MKLFSLLLILAYIGLSLGACTLGTYTACDTNSGIAGLTNQIVSELNSMGYSFR